MSKVEATGESLGVLLIEHNPACSSGFSNNIASLAACWSRFEQAATLPSGLERLREGNVQIVLLDLCVPNNQIKEAFSQLKNADPSVAIIVISDREDEELAFRILQEGAQDYIVKSEIDGSMLRRAIRYATERKRAEIALDREREFSRILEDNIPDRIYFKDTQSRFLRINRAMAELFHLKHPDEAIGKSDFDMFLAEHAQQAFQDEARIMKTGKPLVGIVEKETFPDGTIGWATTTKLPFYDRHHNLLGTFGISRDITSAKQAEENLKATNNDLARSKQQLTETLADLRRSHEQLKAAQLQLIQAEKMQSLGRLSAGIAHEVKNPLAVIRLGADYLNLTINPSDAEKLSTVSEIIAAVTRADTIIRGLLDFAVPRNLDLRHADLRTVIDESLLLVKHEFSDAIRIVKDYSLEVPPVLIDAQKIQQVFVNIFTNAVHAMEKRGVLTIQTRMRAVRPGEVLQNVGSRQADQLRAGQNVVVIDVLDTGRGLTTAQLERVFDPFFTTKSTGKGTGLGMTVAKSIVDLHGGHIAICNRASGGADVTIMLAF